MVGGSPTMTVLDVLEITVGSVTNVEVVVGPVVVLSEGNVEDDDDGTVVLVVVEASVVLVVVLDELVVEVVEDDVDVVLGCWQFACVELQTLSHCVPTSSTRTSYVCVRV